MFDKLKFVGLLKTNATATTIHSGPGRFGGCFDLVELRVPASQTATAQRERECECSAGRASYTASDCTTDGDRESNSGAGCSGNIACRGHGSRAPDPRSHSALSGDVRYAWRGCDQLDHQEEQEHWA